MFVYDLKMFIEIDRIDEDGTIKMRKLKEDVKIKVNMKVGFIPKIDHKQLFEEV